MASRGKNQFRQHFVSVALSISLFLIHSVVMNLGCIVITNRFVFLP